MVNVYEVQAIDLINYIANDLKENKKVKKPEFTEYVKTGCNRERAPDNEDWWYIRMASILRKVYITGNVNVKKLRSYYGGKKNRGVKPEKFKKASGKIIRVCLQELQKLGFIAISDKGGRILTKEGQSYLDKVATIVSKGETSKVVKEKVVKKEKVKEAPVAQTIDVSESKVEEKVEKTE